MLSATLGHAFIPVARMDSSSSLPESLDAQRAALPTRDLWQAAIDKRGYRLRFDDGFVPISYSGTEPRAVACTVLGIESGFELRMTEAEGYLRQYPQLRAKAEARDTCLVFGWGGAMHQLAGAQIACLALLEHCGALVYYPDDDAVLDSAFLADDIEFCLGEIAGQEPE